MPLQDENQVLQRSLESRNASTLFFARRRKNHLESFYQYHQNSESLGLTRLHFSEAEKIELLSRPLEQLKELHIQVGLDALLQVCKLQNLTDLRLVFYEEVLPMEISHLTNLQTLHISTGQFKSVPQSLLTMEKLKHLHFYSPRHDETSHLLPPAYQIFESRLESFTVYPQVVYTEEIQLH